MKKILLSLLLLSSFFACKKSENQYTTEAVAVEAAPLEEKMEPNSETYANIKETSTDSAPASSQKIIKNASLAFETPDLDQTVATIGKAVKKYKALIQSDTESNDGYRLAHYVTVRVPSASFDAFITDIGKGVKYFDRKEISSEDVTAQYIDIEARLKAKKILEARYFELLKKANKVSEMLEIEKELSAIREEIESQQGQLKYMQNRVSLSTITIQFYKNTEVKAGTRVSYGSKIINAVKSGFNGLSGFLLVLIEIWPFILIFVIVYILIRRRIKKKKIHHA